MSEWLTSIAETPEGARLAIILALISAVAHASFGALQKGRHDPWLTRGSIDIWLAVLSLPLIMLVPFPDPQLWPVFVGMVVIHFVYKLTVALAYQQAAYTVVYPVLRGTGPLVTVGAAALIFNEHYTLVQWLGVALLSGSILALSGLNWRDAHVGRAAMQKGLLWAFAGGLMVALYTTYDAWGIRLPKDPFTFLAWFFFLTAMDFPIIACLRWRTLPERPTLAPLLTRGFVGALIAYVSFGGVMLATRLDRVGDAAVLRETSTVFAALIGWLVLGETVGWKRGGLMALIAAGAVLVEVGSA
ncbi:MAG: DMT family transporter [Deltaproteobacteria bacterium]